MKTEEVLEIFKTLPKGKTRFYYFKDRYAFMLLKYMLGAGTSVSELKRTHFGGLLGKPLVKELLKQKGNGLITPDDMECFWPVRPECYFLTVGLWKGDERNWTQTSRRGANIVLHLNFSSKHNEPYYELVDAKKEYPFVYSGHPHAPKGLLTLAWSRIDIDMEMREALIEEVQNDWLREAFYERRHLKRSLDRLSEERKGGQDIQEEHELSKNYRNICKYIEEVLMPHAQMWQEAMLSATLWFLKDVLSISRMFYHTFETGKILKRISWSAPPRSVYTDLPRKFCFEETEEKPELLVKDKSRYLRKLLKNRSRFFKLELPQAHGSYH